MTRNLLVLGTVAVFGLTAAIAGAGDTRSARACDDANKSASAAKSASATSCCAKGATSSASVDAKKIHGSMIKSAMVAPGASGSVVVNAAAFGAMASSGDAACDWCPREMCATANEATAVNAAYTHASACSQKGATTTTAMAAGSCTRDATTAAVHADYSAGHASCDKTTSAAATGCTKDASAVAAGHEGCNKSTSAAAGHEGCEKSASAAAAGCCESGAKSASLKGTVDVLPYSESKRVVLAGSYACGHCTLEKTADCTPMLKTADGKIYPLLKSNRASELRSMEGKGIEVSGVVKKIDGVKFIDVKSYKSI